MRNRPVPKLIQFSKELGLSASFITNGFLLEESFLSEVLPFLDCIGFSIHSISQETKEKIGFCDKCSKSVSKEKLFEMCDFIRKNSFCKIKANTVVNSLNKDENLSSFIKELNVDRWKILRCQHFDRNEKMLVSDDDWDLFCRRNKIENAVFENNMKNSYIMLNPQGFLIKEGADGQSYEEIGSVLENDFEKLLLDFPLETEEYKNRYY